MIKSEELMIGDWVYVKDYNENLRVLEINCDYITLGEGYLHGYKDIEPIPITSKILEKNGFRLKEEGETRTEYVSGDEHSIIEYIFFKETIYGVDALLDCEFGFVGGLDRIHHCHIKYVHELQHALKLCGISKNIEL